MFFPNGVTVMQESTGMRLCRNYYADWDMFSETGYLSISDNETLLDGFIDFCVMYNSSGWLDNPSGTLSIFPKENSYKYNSSIVIKNNEDGSIRTFNSNSLLSGINKSDWLTDDIWVCSTHSDALYTADYVTVYNCKTDARLEYYSALGYEPNENNDGIILHYSDNTKHISTKEIIEQLDERM